MTSERDARSPPLDPLTHVTTILAVDVLVLEAVHELAHPP
jgi:hypothetical protein